MSTETTAMNELLPVVAETKVDSEIQQMLLDRFSLFLEQAATWKQRASELVVTDISQTHEMKMAREARLALREIRLAADKTRKELKEDSLRYGRAVQSVYNVIELSIKPIEEHLERQEKFKELYELQQREALRIEREALAKDYRQYMIANINLGEITETDFNNMLNGAKLQKQAADEAARIAEEQRQARIKAEAEERERLRIENERLKAEAEAREKERKAELGKIEASIQAAKAEAAKAKAEAEAKAAAERAEREKVERELQAKRDAEARAEAERLAKIEAELSMGDRAKFNHFLNDLENLTTKYEFKSKKYKTLYFSACELIGKTINYVNNK